ncbi:hypothetical protein ACVW00_001385 [Marmoricola sp. URHA0025 HA25]
MPELNPLLARLTRGLAHTEAGNPMAMRLCQAFNEIVAADGGSITLGFAPQDRITLCATDDPAAKVEDAQDVLREGPSLDAFRTGAAVSGLSLAEQRHRWPMLSDLLGQSGRSLSLHAFPVRPESAVVGVVCVYQSGERHLAVTDDDAQFLANAVGVALLGHLDSESVTHDRWAVRDRIDQATGMVVAQLRVAPADAVAVLRAHAFAHSTTLAAVSNWVLARELDFSDTDDADGTTQ